MLKPRHTKKSKLDSQNLLSNHSISISILVALTVWTVWLILAGPGHALSNLIAKWQAAVTMIFGSMVAGGTSMGGGAVAFPVFTKVLKFSANEAKVFSLAIQSVGMSAASLTIIAMKTRVEWRFIRWASLGGVPGIILGSVFLAPVLPPNLIKFSFTMMLLSFCIVLLSLNRKRRKRNLVIPLWGTRERIFSLLAGLLGGIVSGLVGSGMDIIGFSMMVLLFGLCEKVSTPTSVILMAINAVVGFILHQYFLRDFEPVANYWLAAVPVVVVGAPTGAILCNLMKRKTITRIVIGLILIELVTSLALIPVQFGSLFVFTISLLIYYWMYNTKTYL